MVIKFIPKVPHVTPGNQDAVSQELTVLRLEKTKNGDSTMLFGQLRDACGFYREEGEMETRNTD